MIDFLACTDTRTVRGPAASAPASGQVRLPLRGPGNPPSRRSIEHE